MSRIEVDDLLASFKGQAIGQEAMDLALLQKQLAQSLRPQGPSRSSGAYPAPIQTSSAHYQYASPSSSYAAPSTSYSTMNTPTSSSVWQNNASYYGLDEPMMHAGAASPITGASRSRSVSRTRDATPRGSRSNSSANLGANASYYDSNDWEEMQEVEEELEPSSSYSDNYQYQIYETNLQQQQQYQNSMCSYPASPSHYQSQAPSSQSSFASSDPFYLATAASIAAASAPAPTSSATTSSNNWFAPAVGFAAYAPTGNRWTPAHVQ